jgi:hypothetical protein
MRRSHTKQREMDMTQVLIRKTATTPEITVQDIEAIETFGQLEHLRSVIEQCVTQIGRENCQKALDRLDRVSDRLNTQ